MKRLHARYPFLSSAREAVDASDVDLLELVRAGDPAVERGLGRVESSLSSGTVGELHRDPRTELLSYPVARVLVSVLDRQALIRRYADAEARTAHERFVREIDAEDHRSVRGDRLTLRQLLAEFDLASDVRAVGEGYRVHAGPYLRLSSSLPDADWRLTARSLADGEVPVDRGELLVLLREAVRERVADELPFEVPDGIADALQPQVEHLEDRLADGRPPAEVDAVVPRLFPPCVRGLLDRARAGEDLPHHSRFALVTFLGSIGLDAGEIAALFPEESGETADYQARRLGGEAGATYPPPSCPTMEAYGDCVDPDERCETIANPLSYYAAALEDADRAEDARDREEPIAESL